MKLLIIKTSSLGDIIHTFPALTDATHQLPDLQVDWVAEESLQELPKLHPKVNQVLPVAIRRWRKNLTSADTYREIKLFIRQLKTTRYDVIIDAQGLLKSAWIAKFAKGLSFGLDKTSAREPLSTYLYDNAIGITKSAHAISRVRMLFANALGYPEPNLSEIAYGLNDTKDVKTTPEKKPYIVFLHGTTWQTKKWPLEHWQNLGQLCEQAGFKILLPWGNQEEHIFAKRISANLSNALVLPKLSLSEVSVYLASSSAVVAVDTGLGHLCAAMNVPTLSLYGPTDPERTGTMGRHQHHIAADFNCAPCLQEKCQYSKDQTIWPPCFSAVPPKHVWQQLSTLIEAA